MRVVQIHNLYDRAGRRRKLIIRFSILCLIGFFIAQVIPTLADEQAKVADLQTQLQSSSSPAPSSTESSTSPAASSSPLPGATTSPSPTPEPVKLTPSQKMTINFPSSINVDPRARVADLPQIRVSGPDFLLVCAVLDKAIVDVVSKGIPDDQSASNLYLTGDLSGRLTISGTTDLVVAALNAGKGIRISAMGTELPSSRAHFSFVSLTKMATDDTFCGNALVGNDRMVSFKPLGVGLNLKKGTVKLG